MDQHCFLNSDTIVPLLEFSQKKHCICEHSDIRQGFAWHIWYLERFRRY